MDKIKAELQKAHNPLEVAYSRLEDSDDRRAIIDRAKRLDDLPLVKVQGELTSGRAIPLMTNQYKVQIDGKRVLHLYAISMDKESMGKGEKPLKKEDQRNVIDNLMKELGIKLAYDGGAYLISPKSFDGIEIEWSGPGGSRGGMRDRGRGDFEARIECTSGKKPSPVKIKVQFVNEMKMAKLQEYLEGDTEDLPSDIVQMIEIIYRTSPMLNSSYVSKGRCMFSEKMNGKNGSSATQAIPIPDGREVWHGMHQSARISHWKSLGHNALTLNIDVSYGIFMKSQSIWELMGEYGERNMRQLEEAIKHLTFECQGMCYKFDRFDQRGDCDNAQMTDPQSKAPINMVDYYDRAGVRLKHTRNVPAICSTAATKGPRGKIPKKFPPELCMLLPGQKPKTENDSHKGNMIRAAAEPAPDRQNAIQAMVDSEEFFPESNEKFGLRLDKKPLEAEGRVLDAPELVGGDEKHIDVKNGQWKSGSFFSARDLKQWVMILVEDPTNRQPVTLRDYEGFGQQFAKVGSKLGCDVKKPLMVESVRGVDDFLNLMKKWKDAGKDPGQLQMMMIAIPDRGSKEYQSLKVLAELNYGVLTQCVKHKNVVNIKPDLIHNLWLKVNEKLGGTNWKISVPLPTSDKPMMVVGCSFTHAEPTSTEPTMVGLCASTQQGATGYISYAEAQDPRLAIVNRRILQNALMHFIKTFMERNNGAKPERIIWYRGGASEGSLQAILKNEFDALRKIFRETDADYQPGITFIVSIRNHRQKIFCANKADQVGQGMNVPAGTAMHGYGGGSPGSFHFHLASHAGVGTLNPTFYQVLHDDNEISLDNMVKMTYALSMDSKRCEKSISEVAPVRLAALRAARAQTHWKGAVSLVESDEIDDRGMKQHLDKDENKLLIRSKFKTSEFFI